MSAGGTSKNVSGGTLWIDTETLRAKEYENLSCFFSLSTIPVAHNSDKEQKHLTQNFQQQKQNNAYY
jgi:hypothetical protein